MAVDPNSFRYTMDDAKACLDKVKSEGEDSVTKQELFGLVWRLARRLHKLDVEFKWPDTDELDS